MKIKFRSLQGIGSAVALAALVAPVATVHAAVPTNLFNNWTVTTGTISPTTGGTVLVNESGFLQESFTDVNGTKLFHTVITDVGATGTPGGTGVGPAAPLAYSDESYVRQDQVSGIMSQQSMQDTTAAGTTAGANDTQVFTNVAKLASGWANTTVVGGGAGGANTTYAASNGILANVDIKQTVWDAGKLDSAVTPAAIAGDEFSNVFHLLITKDSAGTVTGTDTSLNQSVGMGPDLFGTTKSAQIFTGRRLSGTAKVPTTGSITLGTNAAVTWAAGDDVMLTWIGQQTNTTDTNSLSGTQTVFGFEGFTKTVGGTVTKATVSSIADVGFGATGTPSGGFAWDALFGTAPTSTSLQSSITQPVP